MGTRGSVCHRFSEIVVIRNPEMTKKVTTP
jgi:hypothetical protein